MGNPLESALFPRQLSTDHLMEEYDYANYALARIPPTDIAIDARGIAEHRRDELRREIVRRLRGGGRDG